MSHTWLISILIDHDLKGARRTPFFREGCSILKGNDKKTGSRPCWSGNCQHHWMAFSFLKAPHPRHKDVFFCCLIIKQKVWREANDPQSSFSFFFLCETWCLKIYVVPGSKREIPRELRGGWAGEIEEPWIKQGSTNGFSTKATYSKSADTDPCVPSFP